MRAAQIKSFGPPSVNEIVELPEFAVAKAKMLARKPANLNFLEAASAAVVAVTA
jgi:NADPH:quinone reductase-like Zn-dependent oxidoreductase